MPFAPDLSLGGALLLAVYYGCLGALAALGLHRLWLLALSRPAPEPEPPGPAEWPQVLVQLPLYNEPRVAERLVRACAAFDYPAGRLHVQILDDSTDGTTAVLESVIAEVAARPGAPRISHVRRGNRTGFKAGALAAGLAATSEPVVALFDSDFVPPADFLLRTVPALLAEDDIGFVQARWGHLNAGEGWLTRAQATLLDGHFLGEHVARSRHRLVFNFNGTAGVWRRVAIEAAGGWHHDTLTEDFDLSYRARFAGWRGRFLADVVAPAELPASWGDLRGQQSRWARGSMQTLRKLLVPLWRSRLALVEKVEGTLPLVSNGAWILLVLVMVLQGPVFVLRQSGGLWNLFWLDVALLVPATGAFGLYYLWIGRRAGRGWRSALAGAGAGLLLGVGLAVNNGRAALRGLSGSTGVFVRTPKWGSGARPRTQRRIAPGEALLLVSLVATGVWAGMEGVLTAIPFLAFFAFGVGWAARGD